MAGKSKKDEDSFHIYRALNHPLRKRIIELLAEKGSMSFTEFKNTLDVRVGTLYYHFDALSRLISQNEQKRYALTPLGQRAYQLSRSEEYTTAQPLEIPKSQSGPRAYVKNLFLPSGFFSYVYASPKVGIALGLLVISFGSWISFQSRLVPILFFFDRAPTTSQEIFAPLGFVGSWLGVFVLSDLMARGLFQRRGEDHLLLIGTAFSFAPAILFPLAVYLDQLLGPRLLRDPTAARALLAILQAWSIVILSYAVSLSKGLRIDKAAIISLVVAYTNIVLLFVLGRIV